MNTRRCVDCAYSHANTETIVLECRRYPPVIAGLEAVWVQVDTDDWCGEWRAG
jgi:hypothetical protein